MQVLARYLGRTVLSTTLGIFLILLSLIGFVNLLRETNEVGHGQYTFAHAIFYVLLTLLSEGYVIFPVASLLGNILGLSLLARHGELLILRSSGLSLYQIGWQLCKTLSFLLISVILLGEVIAPYANNWAVHQKILLTNNGQTLLTQQGAVWMRDGNNFLYIHAIVKPWYLTGVSRYYFDTSNKLRNISIAKRVYYQKPYWIAEKVTTDYFINQRQVHSTKAQRACWSLSFSPRILRISAIKPAQMSLKHLREYIHFLQTNRSNASQYTWAFWQRLVQPLTIFMMTWLALPFAFSHLRSVATGLRTVLGLIIGFSFYLLNQFLGPLAMAYQWPILLAAVAPITIFSLITYLLLCWVR